MSILDNYELVPFRYSKHRDSNSRTATVSLYAGGRVGRIRFSVELSEEMMPYNSASLFFNRKDDEYVLAFFDDKSGEHRVVHAQSGKNGRYYLDIQSVGIVRRLTEHFGADTAKNATNYIEISDNISDQEGVGVYRILRMFPKPE